MRIPSRYLYRTVLWSVISAVLCGCVWAQIAKKTPKSTGPRALGLVERLVNGKTRLEAICVMVDGKLYDAGTYKATPVPMSLGEETVYEATRNGVSQGLFTVMGARKIRGSWFGEGRWMAAGSEPKRSSAVTSKLVDEDAPPILRRAAPEPKLSDSKSADSEPAGKSAPAKGGDSTIEAAKEQTATSASGEKSTPISAPASEPDRPLLRRSKPGDAPQKFEDKDFTAAVQVKEHFLAVSDAKGPEPRSYLMLAKPDQILAYNKKILEMASQAVVSLYSAQTNANVPPHQAKKTGRSTKVPIVKFTDAQMLVFDLTNSNDPVVVFTGTVDSSEKIAASTGKLTVSVVARVDIYGELRRLLAEATDDHHFDLHPQLEFLDAVDVDGDGAGELVFRETADSGRGFVVYRVGMDRIGPLFDSLRNY